MRGSKFLVYSVLVVMMLGSLVACGPTPTAAPTAPPTEAPTTAPTEAPATPVPAEKIELVMWHSQNQLDARESFQALLDGFMAENPDIEITQTIFNWVDVKPKVMAAIAAGEPPTDMIQVLPDMMVPMLPTGAIQPVDDIIQEVDEKWDYFDSATGPYYKDGHYWAVPAFGIANMLYYRISYFEEKGLEPPKTWDDLVAAAEALTDEEAGVYGIGLPLAKSMYTDQVLWDFLVTNSGDIFDEEGNITFNTPEVIEALALMKELAPYSPPDATNWVWEDANNALAAGSIAMIIQFGHMSNMFAETNPDNPFDLGCVPIPIKTEPGTLGMANAFAIFTTDPVKREAVKRFWIYAMDPENNGKWLGNMSPGLMFPVTDASFPVYLDQAGVDKFRRNIQVELEEGVPYIKQYGFTHELVPDVVGPIAAQNIMGEAVQRMILEDLTPEEAAAWGQEAMEALLE